jgi:hypothetical protein
MWAPYEAKRTIPGLLDFFFSVSAQDRTSLDVSIGVIAAMVVLQRPMVARPQKYESELALEVVVAYLTCFPYNYLKALK